MTVSLDTIDPFTQVMNALWSTLEAHRGFTNLVSLSNRIKFHTGNENPEKSLNQDHDRPEVMIDPVSTTYSLFQTSTHTQVEETYAIRLATASLVTKDLNRTRWEILRAFSKTDDKMGLAFVVKVRFASGVTSVLDPQQNRGKGGWSDVLNVTVTMRFVNRTELQGQAE
jgi:predicted RND superfamily exporter protein